MKSPFPYFGGKRKVAPQVWAALGDVDNYAEPFAGSLAVLLERPAWHTGSIETVNDADRYLANFWRALSHDPEQVARYTDWPVNECDLEARHLWLVNEGQRRMAENLYNDPDWFDAKIAGWWLWGICSWIGSGWCSGTGPHGYTDDEDGGQGINRQRPDLDGNSGLVRGEAFRQEALYAYMHALAARLRNVRVCCGDWSRIVTNGALSAGNTVGIFLDPPYSDLAERDSNLYAVDSLDVAHEVREWCVANGDNPHYRIVLAGYRDEHDSELPSTWQRMAWKANKSYGSSTSAGSANDANRHKEMLWFSPACLNSIPTLFQLEAI